MIGIKKFRKEGKLEPGQNKKKGKSYSLLARVYIVNGFITTT